MNKNKQSFKDFLKKHSEDNVNNKSILDIIENFLNENDIYYNSEFGYYKKYFYCEISNLFLEINANEFDVEFIIKNNIREIYSTSLELRDNQEWLEFNNEILEELQNTIDKTKSIQRTINKIEIYIDKIKDLCEEENLNLNNFIDVKFNMED